MNMEFIGKLPIPMEIKEQYPLPEFAAEIKKQRDTEIKNIFMKKDNRFLLIVGPCSADREDSVLAYMEKLKRLNEKVAEKIFIIPRVYTNKPRTTGAGYKGMLHYPEPSEKPDLLKGVIAIRKLHMRVLTDYGFSSADEMLYPENHRYINDLLSYVTVGARSVENQQHRLTASGLSIPVGMKNPTSGDISVMLNAIQAAKTGHTFCYRGWEVNSKGNPLAHAVLRGYLNRAGQNIPNYHYEDLESLYYECQTVGLRNPALIVDTNHSNSGKRYLEQIRISKEVLDSCRHNSDIKAMVKGLMIESYLEDGNQSIYENTFGRSITDPCLGWQKTERLILEIADLL